MSETHTAHGSKLAGPDRTAADTRKAYQIQLLLLFVISTLLYLGFPSTREWRRIAGQSQMQTVIRGWDGLAWYVWLAAAPVMMILIRRYPLVRGSIGRNLARILLGSLILYLVVTNLRYGLRVLPDVWWGSPPGLYADFPTYVVNTYALLPLDFLTFCGFFAVSFSVDYYFESRHRAEETIRLELRAAQLESDLARAELAALRGQLHPHFLFNSFNALATLIRQHKNDAAVEIIAQLSTLLRLAIDRVGLQEVRLEDEIDFIRRYLEIERVRFGDKLQVGIKVDSAVAGSLVANFVLQPLVENAIKHGISRRTTPGRVELAVVRAGDRLQIEIADDGPDSSPDESAVKAKDRPGIGLANTRARLDNLYPADYRLEMSRRPDGGTRVALELPWRPVPASLLPV